MPIKVIVNGAAGKMGCETVKALIDAKDFDLLARCRRGDDLAAAIRNKCAEVVVDFTEPAAVYDNACTILANGARPVIGTTGLSAEQISDLIERTQAANLAGIIAPNFSIGAVMMMKVASLVAKKFPDCEIIEMHHPQKKDAPSGTAIKTAQLLGETMAKAYSDIPIHSVRLPGLVAHQAVLFGGSGETLTIRHDAIDRSAFMPGVLLACRHVMQSDRLIYGLEQIL